MNLEDPPTSRYRIEEKDGRLIVHDSLAGVRAAPSAPVAPPQDALDGAVRTSSAPPAFSPTSGNDGKGQRGLIVAVIGIFLALFLLVSGLWPIMAIALFIAPVRRQLLDSALPAVKHFINEGSAGQKR